MASPADPIRRTRRGWLATWGLGAPVVVGCAAWAFRPLTDGSTSTGAPSVASTAIVAAPAEPPALDTSAFSAPTWNPPKPPAPKPAAPKRTAPRPPRPAPPPALELVGIVVGPGGVRDAALYDPMANKLRIVREGDALAGFTIGPIRDDTVELRRGTTTTELRLKRTVR